MSCILSPFKFNRRPAEMTTEEATYLADSDDEAQTSVDEIDAFERRLRGELTASKPAVKMEVRQAVTDSAFCSSWR